MKAGGTATPIPQQLLVVVIVLILRLLLLLLLQRRPQRTITTLIVVALQVTARMLVRRALPLPPRHLSSNSNNVSGCHRPLFCRSFQQQRGVAEGRPQRMPLLICHSHRQQPQIRRRQQKGKEEKMRLSVVVPLLLLLLLRQCQQPH